MELQIIEIREASTEDERIFMKATEKCNLSNYLIYDETFDAEGNPSNLLPHMYRFPNIEVEKGDRVSLRTQHKNRKYSKGTLGDNKTPCHYLYWGLDTNIFNNDGDTVHLIKIANEQKKNVE